MTFIPLQEAVDITQKEDIKQVDNLRERILDLEKKAKNIDSISNFMMWITGGVLLGFLFTSVLISLDYFRYNQERYEKFIAAMKMVEDNMVKKDQIDNLQNLENNNEKILNCMKIKKSFSVQCFD